MRPPNIKPATTWTQFMRIKPSHHKWNGRDLDEVKGTPMENALINEMYRWANFRKDNHYQSDYDKTIDKIEKNVGMKYWVYSHANDMYFERKMTERTIIRVNDAENRNRLVDLIKVGVVYIHAEDTPYLEEDALKRLREKYPLLRELEKVFKLKINV